MSADDNFAGPPPTLFASGILVVDLAPAFDLKAVDDTCIRNVAAQYEVVHQRVDAIYQLG